ncbi:MAG TPA: sulfite exporter TauE/SafE family protein [Candidatus Sulfotelmatobacter sp.]|nr:sulfite exporter TauE/SafE family protein [Candidatus Sulfotelmatobacter sp.]
MQVYLPIAEMSVNALVILVLGGMVGFLSGLFGVGGGFLMTPLLIFVGVPPAVAVGTQSNQLVGASVTGVIGHWRRGNVDFRMGMVLLVGGLMGSLVGVWLFRVLRRAGHIDLVISLLYVILLGVVGGLMLAESVSALLRQRRKTAVRRKLHQHIWLHGLPLKMRFHKSRLYISAVVPLAIGVLGGMAVAILGVGGGFFMVPAMIYLLGMPTAMVPGTSLFQITFTTAAVTILQAMTNHTVDAMLALLLLIGGVVGAQFGTRFGVSLRGEQMRALLALLVVGVCIKLFVDLAIRPDDVYSLVLPPPS